MKRYRFGKLGGRPNPRVGRVAPRGDTPNGPLARPGASSGRE